jgi:hypothetical protein
MLKLSIGFIFSPLPAAAVTQAIPGPYISGNIGAGAFDGSLRSILSTTKIGVDTGVSGVAAAGWRFRDGLRVEFQGSAQSNAVSDISTRRGDGNLHFLGGVGGHLSTYSAMANVLYDLPVQRYVGALQPYVGAGAGYRWLDFGGLGGAGFAVFHLC